MILKVIKHGKKSDMYDEVIRRLEWKYNYIIILGTRKSNGNRVERLINSELADEYAETILFLQ